MNTTFTMMVGLPRSGKSTWVSEHRGRAVVVCPDDVRLEIFGHLFHKAAEGFVWAFCKAMVTMLLKQGTSVIMDATSINYGTRLEWMRLAKGCGARTRIVWVNTPSKECLRRNAGKAKKVPPDVITRMEGALEEPSRVEADVLTVVKWNKKGSKS